MNPVTGEQVGLSPSSVASDEEQWIKINSKTTVMEMFRQAKEKGIPFNAIESVLKGVYKDIAPSVDALKHIERKDIPVFGISDLYNTHNGSFCVVGAMIAHIKDKHSSKYSAYYSRAASLYERFIVRREAQDGGIGESHSLLGGLLYFYNELNFLHLKKLQQLNDGQDWLGLRNYLLSLNIYKDVAKYAKRFISFEEWHVTHPKKPVLSKSAVLDQMINNS